MFRAFSSNHRGPSSTHNLSRGVARINCSCVRILQAKISTAARLRGISALKILRWMWSAAAAYARSARIETLCSVPSLAQYTVIPPHQAGNLFPTGPLEVSMLNCMLDLNCMREAIDLTQYSTHVPRPMTDWMPDHQLLVKPQYLSMDLPPRTKALYGRLDACRLAESLHNRFASSDNRPTAR